MLEVGACPVRAGLGSGAASYALLTARDAESMSEATFALACREEPARER
jgi:hypothetical protein